MLSKSGRPYHFGINYVLAPLPILTKEIFFAFQKEISSQGIDFVTAQREESSFILSNESQSPNLQVKIIAETRSPVNIGQLLIIEPQPKGDLNFFIKQTEAICLAFNNIWKHWSCFF